LIKRCFDEMGMWHNNNLMKIKLDKKVIL